MLKVKNPTPLYRNEDGAVKKKNNIGYHFPMKTTKRAAAAMGNLPHFPVVFQQPCG